MLTFDCLRIVKDTRSNVDICSYYLDFPRKRELQPLNSPYWTKVQQISSQKPSIFLLDVNFRLVYEFCFTPSKQNSISIGIWLTGIPKESLFELFRIGMDKDSGTVNTSTKRVPSICMSTLRDPSLGSGGSSS